ncbi:major facilitator superfamily domain-containing protein [Hyaloraphidium curvatum]|nr:major facilitator superfamily domain-containing protein [Hyaloraphidium curvatum]
MNQLNRPAVSPTPSFEVLFRKCSPILSPIRLECGISEVIADRHTGGPRQRRTPTGDPHTQDLYGELTGSQDAGLESQRSTLYEPGNGHGTPPYPAPPAPVMTGEDVKYPSVTVPETYDHKPAGELAEGLEAPVETPRATYTREEEAKVIRGMDFKLIPWLGFLYLLSQLDRSNIANAVIMNAETPESTMIYQLGLTGNEFNNAVTIFFVGYILFEIPSNMMMTRFTPSKWLARIIVTWGLCSTLMGATFNYGSLMACRFFLGLFEAGLFPGLLFYLQFWYRKTELAARVGSFYAASNIATGFGGLIAAGIARMNGAGGLAGWRWLFILEGIPTILMGIATWFYLPDYPQTAHRWLFTERQTDVILARLPPANPSYDSLEFNKSEFFSTFKDVKLYLFMVAACSLISTLYAFAYFSPTIVSKMGYSSTQSQLLSAALNISGAFWVVFINFSSDRFNERPLHIAASLVCPIIGFFIQAFVAPNLSSVSTRYGLLFLVITSNGAVPLVFTYRTDTVSGTTKNAAAAAAVVAAGNVGGLIGGQIYQPKDAPYYRVGHCVNAGLLCVTLVCIFTLKLLFMRDGKRAEFEVPQKEYSTGRRESVGV